MNDDLLKIGTMIATLCCFTPSSAVAQTPTPDDFIFERSRIFCGSNNNIGILTIRDIEPDGSTSGNLTMRLYMPFSSQVERLTAAIDNIKYAFSENRIEFVLQLSGGNMSRGTHTLNFPISSCMFMKSPGIPN